MAGCERELLIEWLFVITGTRKEFWEAYQTQTLKELYEKTVSEHGQLAL